MTSAVKANRKAAIGLRTNAKKFWSVMTKPCRNPISIGAPKMNPMMIGANGKPFKRNRNPPIPATITTVKSNGLLRVANAPIKDRSTTAGINREIGARSNFAYSPAPTAPTTRIIILAKKNRIKIHYI